jgi:hypothetical protein
MKTLPILVGMVMAAGPALAACGARPVPVIDWGLHRQYLIERDCAHPERPATLAEVPWSDAAAERARVQGHANPPALATLEHLPWLVHAGMSVTVVGQIAETGVHLVGMALEQGHAGDSIRVRTGLHGAILRGIVRGPGLVELEPLRGQN